VCFGGYAGLVVDPLGVQCWLALTRGLILCVSVLGFLIPDVRKLEQRKMAPLVTEDQA
jgi:hypothetical protein